MKHKLHLFFSFLFLSFFTFSQSNTLVIFAEDPTPFFVVVDGVKKNEKGATRVTVPDIDQTNSSVKIFFEDEGIEPISKNIWWDNWHNDEVSFRIVSTKRGYKLRLFSTKKRVPPAVTQTTPPPTQNVQSTTTTTVTETTRVNGGNVDMNSNMNGGSVNMNINMNENTNQSSDSENMSLNMNINVNDGSTNNSENVNMSLNMNVNENTSNNANMNMNMDVNENMTTNTSVNESVTTTTTTTTTVNETSSGCAQPETDMYNIMNAIENESFDDEKMIVAKQATANSCLTVNQIKQIMDEFSFSDEKLEFAKYGYDRCYNPKDYYQINSSFDFGSEKEELDKYIKSRKGQ